MELTPGPWNYNWVYTLLRHSRKQEGPWDDYIDDGNHPSDGDAALITAAPDLLKICERLWESAEYWGHYDVPLGIADDLRDVIKKAKGETE